jgi:cob(I)alamin adenosyltransferase
MKVYTKTGDDGTTALIGGERVSKADVRVEAYGTVDELAAHLALLADMIGDEAGLADLVADMKTIQGDLMVVEAMLATGRRADDGSGRAENSVTPLPAGAIERLERQIDRMGEKLPPLKGFVIPGGHPAVSQSHVCRTVCRRAERATVRAAENHPMPVVAARYLNRLSDWLYVAGRKMVEVLGIKETYWIP